MLTVWLVCDWWHGKGQSQVFWRNKYFPLSSYPTLATCADVDLIPQSVSK